MKKIIILLIAAILLIGCDIAEDMDNTPTRRVESFLDAYQRLDSNVLNDLDNLIENNRYTLEQRTAYKELMKEHYRNLRYEIKDETINGVCNAYQSFCGNDVLRDDWAICSQRCLVRHHYR